MRRFRNGQRVLVHVVGDGDEPTELQSPAAGTVVRLRRCDVGAWVRLDERIENPHVHPFPADDANDRANHVLTFPEYCEPTLKSIPARPWRINVYENVEGPNYQLQAADGEVIGNFCSDEYPVPGAAKAIAEHIVSLVNAEHAKGGG